jgi:hypothetical protein
MKNIKTNRLFKSLPSSIFAFAIMATALAGTGLKTPKTDTKNSTPTFTKVGEPCSYTRTEIVTCSNCSYFPNSDNCTCSPSTTSTTVQGMLVLNECTKTGTAKVGFNKLGVTCEAGTSSSCKQITPTCEEVVSGGP